MLKAKRAKLIEIHSIDEIPAQMSEDEEAEFWATHSLGPELLAKMEPVPDGILPPARERTINPKQRSH